MKENIEKIDTKIESLPTEETNKLNQDLNLFGDNLVTQREKKSNLKSDAVVEKKKTVHFRGDDNLNQRIESVIIFPKEEEDEKNKDENIKKKGKTKCKCCCFIF